MLIGFGGLVWIIKVLNSSNDNQTKLKFIHTRTIIHTYLFLFITRILLVCAIFGPLFCWSILGCYVCLNLIDSIDRFLKKDEEWLKEHKQTLYELKQKYYVKRKN
jgi:hypothetical protein